MIALRRIGVAVLATLVLASPRFVADATVSADLFSGDTGDDIAIAFDDAWSQGMEFTCSRRNNVLVVDDRTGDCDEPRSRYEFDPDGGQVSEDHTMQLNVSCASPTAASMNLDGLGFVPLSLGSNVFVSGSDTIRVNFSFPPLITVPTTPGWGPAVLVGLVLGVGVILLLRR
jgi:hypothetical protein